MDTAVIAQGALGPAADFTIWSLFLKADIVVKSVMVGLVLASIWSWAVIIDKSIRLSGLRRRADKFEDTFWSGKPLEELHEHFSRRADHPLAQMFVAAMREWRRSTAPATGAPLSGAKDRADKVMQVTMSRELARLEKQMGYLATVGAVAPFVGLFGTVWGIMNAFMAIGMTKDTSLAVVAPGIAEALFATALGLLAAIPAVIFYNSLNNGIGRYAVRLEGFADEFSAILSRQMDERKG